MLYVTCILYISNCALQVSLLLLPWNVPSTATHVEAGGPGEELGGCDDLPAHLDDWLPGGAAPAPL